MLMKNTSHIAILYRKTNGFTLIEVLIAMLVIAIGFMGITALQYKGLKYNTDAVLRTQINFLAYDLADRMRLNRDNIASYVDNDTITTTAPTGCNEATGADATNDLNCWKLLAYNSLPPGTTTDISVSGSQYTITIGWTDRDGTTRNISYTFQ